MSLHISHNNKTNRNREEKNRNYDTANQQQQQNEKNNNNTRQGHHNRGGCGRRTWMLFFLCHSCTWRINWIAKRLFNATSLKLTYKCRAWKRRQERENEEHQLCFQRQRRTHFCWRYALEYRNRLCVSEYVCITVAAKLLL